MIARKRIAVYFSFLIIVMGTLSFGLDCSRTRGNGSADITVRYSNPVIDRYLADPFILRSGAYYYMFATGKASDGRYIQIYRSKDLAEWDFVRGAVTRGSENSWNRKNFWAPEVIEIEGRFHLYYTASTDGTPDNTGNRVGHAVSDYPEGPYEDRGVVIPHASLDGSPFRDTDGTLYLYYTIEHGNSDGLVAGRIYVDTLVTPDEVSGNPVPCITHHSWQEGACVMVRDGRYYLTYSTGNWRDESYRIRWAAGSSPIGPFEEKGTLLKSTAQVKGPGHHSFFTGPGGHDWIVYHGWDPEFIARYPRIDPLNVTRQGLSVDGPTSGPQTVRRPE